MDATRCIDIEGNDINGYQLVESVHSAQRWRAADVDTAAEANRRVHGHLGR